MVKKVKQWNKFKGIRICRFKRTNTKGNLRRSPYCLDFRKRRDLIIDKYNEYYTAYCNVIRMRDGFGFIMLLQEVINEYFDNADGRYWIGGKYVNDKYQLYRCPVLYIEYIGGNIRLYKRKSYRQRYGKHKSTAKTYYGIKEFPVLLDLT